VVPGCAGPKSWLALTGRPQAPQFFSASDALGLTETRTVGCQLSIGYPSGRAEEVEGLEEGVQNCLGRPKWTCTRKLPAWCQAGMCSMPTLGESSEYQDGAVVSYRPTGRAGRSQHNGNGPREVWPWAMKLLFGRLVFFVIGPLPMN